LLRSDRFERGGTTLLRHKDRGQLVHELVTWKRRALDKHALTLGFAASVLVVCNGALAALKTPVFPDGMTTLAQPSLKDPVFHGAMTMLAQADQALTDGEVRKIDKDAQKITLKHGEIRNLAMPPMTMVFQVKDPAMLERVKTGDKVRFRAEKLSGALVVTRIEAATPP
jgi:Cu/Ag efflux protein CusF